LTQLQQLEQDSGGLKISAQEVAAILTSCKQLTSLALNYSIFLVEFDALLKHGPQLTSFACSRLILKEDRSASPCSLKELVLKYYECSTETLAHIPAAGPTHLVVGPSMVFPSPSPTLKTSCPGTGFTQRPCQRWCIAACPT
jgi:hypothetical protein